MSRLNIILRATALVTLLLAGGSSALVAQGWERAPDAGYVGATRESLQQLQAYYDAAARSQAYSAELRAEARGQADAVRERLGGGDFRVGDRIVLSVAEEPILNDTFVVQKGPLVELPTLGEVTLRGVLRSELADHMEDQIGRYINDPQVRARSFIRISVSGEVGAPGFYTLPAEMPVTEAIMGIGGPAATADVSRLKVYRGTQQLWGGEALQLAIRQGRTLDELDIQDGDEIFVPRKSPFSPGEIGRTLLVLSGTIIAISTLFRRL